MIHNKTFTGAGYNDSSWLRALSNLLNSPSNKTLPAGATWPFVTLSISEKSVDFSMFQIKKTANPASAKVTLNKLGYVCFQTPNHANDFAFLTLKVSTLLKVLKAQGYHLEESCERNMLAAKISLTLMLIVSVTVVALVIIMSIIKPNGV